MNDKIESSMVIYTLIRKLHQTLQLHCHPNCRTILHNSWQNFNDLKNTNI